MTVGTRMIAEYGGIAKVMPWYAIVFTIVTLSSIGVPGLNGFIGEFLILVGAFKASPVAAVIGATGVILAAIYMLWMLRRVFFGPLTNKANESLTDLKPVEWASLLPLLVFIVWIGVHPNTFLSKFSASIETFLTQVVR